MRMAMVSIKINPVFNFEFSFVAEFSLKIQGVFEPKVGQSVLSFRSRVQADNSSRN